MKDWTMPDIRHLVPTKLGWCVSNPIGLKLGKFTDIGYGTYIQAEYGVEIGDNTQIGSHVSIYSKNTIDGTKGAVVIGKDVRIGSHALILPGVTIEDGAFIKAYQIVK